MQSLTAEGRSTLAQIATRHNVGTDAVETLLEALLRGGGTQAQFSHPDLGGMGQWSRGGMVMIGDMFNNGLKTKVDDLCRDVSDLLRNPAIWESGGRSADGVAGPGDWWPSDCGQPRSSGSQNDCRYAYFPDTRRLAIQRSGTVTLYDTADHQITGVSQQQSGSQDLAFTSQYGVVRIHDLARIGEGHSAHPQPTHQEPARQEPKRLESGHQDTTPAAGRPESKPVARPTGGIRDDDIFAKIERLHDLRTKGVISEADYAEKKKELLDRI